MPRALALPRLLRGLHPRARCARFAACVLSALSLPCETHLSNPRLAADLLRPCSRRLYEMQTNEIPTSAPGDRAPTSEEPAPIKMTNQQAELNQLEQPSCSLSLALS